MIDTSTTKASVSTESKMTVCKRLFQQHINKTRAEMIALFMKDAGCTKAGASTYYQNCKKFFDQ